MRGTHSVTTLRTFLLAALGTAASCGGSTANDISTGDAGAKSDASASDASTSSDSAVVTDATTPPKDGGKSDARAQDGGSAACVSPQPILIDGKDTGFDQCAGGRVVRRAAYKCPNLLPRAGGGACPFPDAGFAGDCLSDSDCSGTPNSFCMGGVQLPACYCNHGCLQDSDCAAGQICHCGSPVGRCEASNCKDATSCAGGECALYDSSQGCNALQFACTTGGDKCNVEADCNIDASAGGMCLYDSTTKIWDCKFGFCAIGRPFTVGADVRVAPVVARSDWSHGRGRVAGALDADTRERVAAHWATVARLEHASIASFARFALELLALGAGPELLEATQAAMSDEIRHARIAFGLASTHGGAPVGPGPLAIDGTVEAFSLPTFVQRLVREGCVGETLGALEAAEAASRAVDPELRRTLESIAHDESLHAVLAWRALRFAIERGGTVIAELAEETIERAIAELAASLDASDAVCGLEAYGVLDTATRASLHARAAAEILAPCRDVALRPQEKLSGENVAPSLS